MGAPKQKWTAEEEAALRAGVEKYGPGKWRAIQKDPKFGPCLTSRSNVDLKDKWRNMSVSANGTGSSRERKSLALSSGTGMMTLMEEAVAVTPLASASPDGDSKPLLLTGPGSKSSDRKSLGPRYDDIVVEAVLGLKDAKGSSNASIASYIEERHPVPPNFRRLLTSKLKALTFQGKLVKVKQDYKVPSSTANDTPTEVAKPVKNTRPRRPEAAAAAAPAPAVPEEIRRTPRFPRDPAKKIRGDRDVNAKKSKAVDTEVARTKMKTAEEAARAAVQAVAEAEAAAAAAEQAAREAELAEAEAEAAEAAAQAAAQAARPHKRSAVRAMAMARAEEVSVKG